jgi:hypothetical protein
MTAENQKNIDISYKNENAQEKPETLNHFRYHYKPSEAPHYDREDEPDTIIAQPSKPPLRLKRSLSQKLVKSIIMALSLVWVAICVAFFIMDSGFAMQTPYETGLFLAGMCMPLAFLWMIMSYLQRNRDMQFYAETLRAEMYHLFFPSEDDSENVNKDIERMALQAAELAAASKAAMQSIRKTRQGLRMEIREFAGFAKKTETYISSLSETLVKRAENAESLFSTLDERLQTIEGRSDKAVTIWDDASARMVERAADIEATLENSADRIVHMAAQAEQKGLSIRANLDETIITFDQTLNNGADRIMAGQDAFKAQLDGFKQAANDIGQEVTRIDTMMGDHVDSLRNVTGQSVETITNATSQVTQEASILEEYTNRLTAQADHMTDGLKNVMETMEQNASETLERIEDVQMRVSDNVSILDTTSLHLIDQSKKLERSTSLIEKTFDTLRSEIANDTHRTVEAIEKTVNLTIEKSAEATQEMLSMIEANQAHVQSLADAKEEHVSYAETYLNTLQQTYEVIQNHTVVAVEESEKLYHTLDTKTELLKSESVQLADQIKAVTETLHYPLDLVSDAVAQVDNKHEAINQTLQNRISDLSEAGDKAADIIQTIRQDLHTQTTEISTLSGTLITHSKTLNQQLAENKKLIGETIDANMNDVTRYIEDIADKSGQISMSSFNIVKHVGDASEALSQARQDFDIMFNHATTSMDEARSDFVTQTDNVVSKMNAITDITRETTLQISQAAQEIEPVYKTIENGSRAAMSELLHIQDGYNDLSDLSFNRMNEAANLFDEKLSQIQSGSKQARESLNIIGSSIKDNLNDIELSADKAHGKMQKLSSAIKTQGDDINLLSDHVLAKIGGTQKILHGHLQDLSVSIGLAVTQIEEAGDKFGDQSVRMRQDADMIASAFVEAGDYIEAKTDSLKKTSVKMSEFCGAIASDIHDTIQHLEKNSRGAIHEMSQASAQFVEQSKEMDSVLTLSVNNSKEGFITLRNEVKQLSDETVQSVSFVNDANHELLKTVNEVGSQAKSVMTCLDISKDSLAEQSAHYLAVLNKSANFAEQTSAIFTSQTDNLIKASKLATDKIADIRAGELEAGRETFLNATRFVMESLHSLSVDVVRTLDGDIQSRDWKAYQNGDIAIFTGKLVERLDQIRSDMVRHKYAEDHDFRSYVQKFIRQYEDVLTQADTVDRGAVLGTVFVASDIGKIYRFLCTIKG